MKKVWDRGDPKEIGEHGDNQFMKLIEEWDFEEAAESQEMDDDEDEDEEV